MAAEGSEARTGKCGNGAPGPDGRTTFGLDFVPPTVPKREWNHPPLEGKGNNHLDAAAFREGLRDHPNRQFVEYVCEGIVNGYDTLIEGDLEGGPQRHPNSSSMTEAQKAHVIREWDAEVNAGRYVRVRHDAHPHLRTQSLGCVDKGTPEPGAEQKYRTVINLSHKWHGGESNNCGMQELELKFIKVQHVIEQILAVGPEAVCNTYDMRAAYRQLRKRADLAHLYGLRLDFDGRDETVCDFHIEFGGKASAWIFSAFSQALCYIVQQNLDKVCGVGVCTAFAYLDDVGVVCTNRWVAAKAYRVVLDTWTQLGVVASAEKCCGTRSRVQWLGIMLDCLRATKDLPALKKAKYRQALRRMELPGRSTGKAFEVSAGRLGFAHSVHRDLRCFSMELYHLRNKCGRSTTATARLQRHTTTLMVDAMTWGAFLDWAPPAKMEAAVTTQAVGELWPMVPGQEKGVHWLCGDASGGRLDGVSPDGGGWFGGDEHGANFHAYRPWTSQDRRDLATLNGETSSTFLETVVMAEAVCNYLITNDISDCRLQYWTDCGALHANWANRRSRQRITNAEHRKIALLLVARGVELIVIWSPRGSKYSQWADTLSHCLYPQDMCHTWPASRRFVTQGLTPTPTAASQTTLISLCKQRWQTER